MCWTRWAHHTPSRTAGLPTEAAPTAPRRGAGGGKGLRPWAAARKSRSIPGQSGGMRDSNDKKILDLIIIYVIDRVSHIFDGAVQLSPRVSVPAWQTSPVAEYFPV